MVYAGKHDILGIIKFFRPLYTEINISDDLQGLATSDVNAALVHKHVPLPATDMHDLLKSAEVCFYMEQAGMVREIENAFGVVGQETIGNYTKKYENGMPMFFFAQGSSTPFLELLPHETWRMRGYKYITSYVSVYQKSLATSPYVSTLYQDNTGRGYGWQDSVSDYNTTTRRFG